MRLTRTLLEPYVLSVSDLTTWGYFVQIPEGAGGDNPSQEGKVAKCERCTQPFLVKRREEADECTYHWGKPYTTKINGEIPLEILPALPAYTSSQVKNSDYTIAVQDLLWIAKVVLTAHMCFMNPKQKTYTLDTLSHFWSHQVGERQPWMLLQLIAR